MSDTQNLLRLADWLIQHLLDDCGGDLDGGDLQDKLVEHGLLQGRPATAEDCAEDWAQEYDVGDPIFVRTPLGNRARSAASEAEDGR